MKTRHIITSLFMASGAMLAFLPAYADIGGIGSPVRPSNPPPPLAAGNAAAPQPAPPATQDAEPRTPLLVIRFNQQHVYFDRVLRQAVDATEKTKAGAVYDVVSIVPSGGSREQNERISADAADNLNAVVQQLQDLGVQPSRIQASTQSSTAVTAQEIDIFVN